MSRAEAGYDVVGDGDDAEDEIADHCLIRVVHAIAYLLTVVLSFTAAAFICYQLSALYVPYCKAKITGDKEYRFPEYFYKVWGDDATDLTIGALGLPHFLLRCHFHEFQ